MSMFQHNPFLSTKFCILTHFKVHTYTQFQQISQISLGKKALFIVLPKCKNGEKERGEGVEFQNIVFLFSNQLNC